MCEWLVSALQVVCVEGQRTVLLATAVPRSHGGGNGRCARSFTSPSSYSSQGGRLLSSRCPAHPRARLSLAADCICSLACKARAPAPPKPGRDMPPSIRVRLQNNVLVPAGIREGWGSPVLPSWECRGARSRCLCRPSPLWSGRCRLLSPRSQQGSSRSRVGMGDELVALPSPLHQLHAADSATGPTVAILTGRPHHRPWSPWANCWSTKRAGPGPAH